MSTCPVGKGSTSKEAAICNRDERTEPDRSATHSSVPAYPECCRVGRRFSSVLDFEASKQNESSDIQAGSISQNLVPSGRIIDSTK